jgi:hypothetical protein
MGTETMCCYFLNVQYYVLFCWKQRGSYEILCCVVLLLFSEHVQPVCSVLQLFLFLNISINALPLLLNDSCYTEWVNCNRSDIGWESRLQVWREISNSISLKLIFRGARLCCRGHLYKSNIFMDICDAATATKNWFLEVVCLMKPPRKIDF